MSYFRDAGTFLIRRDLCALCDPSVASVLRASNTESTEEAQKAHRLTPKLGEHRTAGSDLFSTSFVERQNLTLRMGMRRFTRLTNGFSKKVENHAYQVALRFMHYNFVRIHKTLRVTPAQEAGVMDRLWTVEDIVNRLPAPVAKKRGPYKKKVAR